ncbi:MAG: 50S ribosomal protein L18 [Magnetococcus sp. WYHC-3]
MAKSRIEARQARAVRTRFKIRQNGGGRLRLSVHRTARHMYAQIIDDASGTTLVSASTLEKDVRDTLSHGGNKDAAVLIGQRIAAKAKAANITQVVFDRGGFIFHGRTKALADAAREGGLEF